MLDALPPGRRAIAFDLPAHGGSAPLPHKGLEPVVEAVHDAVVAAGLDRPIVVGHSIGGPIAAIYATKHPAAAVVSIEAPLRLEPFADLLRPLAPELRGEGFGAAWSRLQAGWRIDLLPPPARALLDAGNRPSQPVVLSYQSDLLDRPLDEIVRRRDAGLARLRDAAIPYVVLAANPVPASKRAWLAERLPQADVDRLAGRAPLPPARRSRVVRGARHDARSRAPAVAGLSDGGRDCRCGRSAGRREAAAVNGSPPEALSRARAARMRAASRRPPRRRQPGRRRSPARAPRPPRRPQQAQPVEPQVDVHERLRRDRPHARLCERAERADAGDGGGDGHSEHAGRAVAGRDRESRRRSPSDAKVGSILVRRAIGGAQGQNDTGGQRGASKTAPKPPVPP